MVNLILLSPGTPGSPKLSSFAPARNVSNGCTISGHTRNTPPTGVPGPSVQLSDPFCNRRDHSTTRFGGFSAHYGHCGQIDKIAHRVVVVLVAHFPLGVFPTAFRAPLITRSCIGVICGSPKLISHIKGRCDDGALATSCWQLQGSGQARAHQRKSSMNSCCQILHHNERVSNESRNEMHIAPRRNKSNLKC